MCLLFVVVSNKLLKCKLVGIAGINSSDGQVVRASALGAVDLGLIPSRVKPIALKLVSTASLFDAQHLRDSVESKQANLLVPLGKAISGISPSWCGRQMAGNS